MEKDVGRLGDRVTYKTLEEPEQKIFDGKPFPLIITPTDDEQFVDSADVNEWLKEKKEDLKDLLLKYAAILFRGFPVDAPVQFDKFVRSLGFDAFPYIGGAAPRNVVVGDVFTTNEAPPDKLIAFHHEVSQAPKSPETIFFYCDVPAKENGQTAIVLSNVVYREMKKREPDFVSELEEKGVHYIRVLPDGDDNNSAIGRGWQSTYLADEKHEAEERAREQGTTFSWLPDGSMKTTTMLLPAMRVDKRTNKMMWFNAIDDAYRAYDDERNIPEESVCFGDGKYMEADKMATMKDVLEGNAVDYMWRHGDVIMIDNIQVLHARRPFEHPRKVYAWMCI